MRNSESSVELKMGGDAYGLLRSYARESKILASAYHMSECYYRNLYKYFNYPVVILSGVTSVCAGLKLNEYVIMGLSLSMLILLGFDKLIDPKDKEQSANRYSVEYNEINGNVKQFIRSNNRTKEEIKSYSETVYSLLAKWKSFNPPVTESFILKAKLQNIEKLRSHKMSVMNLDIVPNDSQKKKKSTDITLPSNIVVNI